MTEITDANLQVCHDRAPEGQIEMAQNAQILNGWKSIAAHFGRERTTVVRWAQDRGLPVHRIPGGRIAKVFAYPCELDRWFESGGTVCDPAPQDN